MGVTKGKLDGLFSALQAIVNNTFVFRPDFTRTVLIGPRDVIYATDSRVLVRVEGIDAKSALGDYFMRRNLADMRRVGPDKATALDEILRAGSVEDGCLPMMYDPDLLYRALRPHKALGSSVTISFKGYGGHPPYLRMESDTLAPFGHIAVASVLMGVRR